MNSTRHDIVSVESFVIELIEEETGIGGVTPETRLDELSMDSLTFSEVLINVEKKFGVNLDEIQEGSSVKHDSTVAHFIREIFDEFS